jgi:hypothetical protein
VYEYFQEVEQLMDPLKIYPTGESMEDFLWRLPILAFEGNLFSRRNILSLPELRTSYEALQKDPNHQGIYRRYLDNTSFHGVLLTICVTERGYLGVVPYCTRLEDYVSVLHGGTVPYILRKSEERPGSYQLVETVTYVAS